MSYRYVPSDGHPSYWFFGQAASGEASLGSSFGTLVLDGKTLNSAFYYTGSGCTGVGQKLRYSGVTHIIEHEICHSFLVDNLNGYDAYHSWLGLMTGLDGTCYNMSPYERSRSITGWNVNPINVTPMPVNQDFTLGDYVATGNMLRISIPNSSEYFWVANHQKVSLYDGVSRGSKECFDINLGGQDPYCGAGKGLFIYHESSNSCPNNFGHGFELEQADGRWNWTVDRMVPYWNPPPYFDLPLFEHISPNGGNPNYGYGEYLWTIVANNGSGNQFVSDDPCSDNPNDYFVTNDAWGEGLDGFNMSYDEIFNPYSNPRTSSCANPEANTGLTVRLINQNVSGDITVRIYFDDNLALLECAPSKPKNLKVTQYGIGGNAFHPKLTWDANIEPDFVTPLGEPVPPARYGIYRGNSMDCSIEPSYTFITTVQSNITQYIDNAVTLYPRNSGSGSCQYQFISYSYKVSAIDYSNFQSVKSDRSIINGYHNPCMEQDNLTYQENDIPKSFYMYNYPNPFNPTTEIRYELPRAEFITISVFNLLGQVVTVLAERDFKEAGRHSMSFDGKNLASGIYIYRIEAGSFIDTKKMVLIK